MKGTPLVLVIAALVFVFPISGELFATDCNPCDEDDDFDSTGGGTIDVDIRDIYPGTVNPPIAMAMVNGAEKAYFASYCSGSYVGIDCTDACSASYSSSTGQFGVEIGDCYITRQGDGPSGSTLYGKFLINDRTYNGNNSFYDLTYDALGACSCGAPPTANFTFTTYDLIGFFTDTSTESPTSWSWAFGGTGSSTSQNPRHYFGTANTYSVTLTATNASGSDGETKSVTVSEEASDDVTTGTPLDLNGDGTDDLTIINAGPVAGCGANAALQVINGAKWSSFSQDYRTVDAGDIPASITGTSPFCIPEGVTGLSSGAFIQTDTALPSFGTYKMWTPDNTGTLVRAIFEALSTTLPDPPVTSWIFSTYDQIGFFTDTSTDNPGTWSWNFGDGNVSTAQHPDHFYATAGTRTVCMTASNLGGSGLEVCKKVTTSQQPGATGTSIDFDMDGTADLTSFFPGGCGSRRALRRVGNVRHGAPSGQSDYRFVDSSHIPQGIDGTGDFCVAIGVEGLQDTRLVLTSSGQIFKFWTPENTSSSVRFEYAMLGTACNTSYERTDITLSGTDTILGCAGLTIGANVLVVSGANAGLFSGEAVKVANGLTVQTSAALTIGDCGHDLCAKNPAPLDPDCHPCVTDICAVDGFCCATAWDTGCVERVASVCSLICQ